MLVFKARAYYKKPRPTITWPGFASGLPPVVVGVPLLLPSCNLPPWFTLAEAEPIMVPSSIGAIRIDLLNRSSVFSTMAKTIFFGGDFVHFVKAFMEFFDTFPFYAKRKISPLILDTPSGLQIPGKVFHYRDTFYNPPVNFVVNLNWTSKNHGMTEKQSFFPGSGRESAGISRPVWP